MVLLSDGGLESVPTIKSTFSQDQISMDLTMCGLLVEESEEMAGLYKEKSSWNKVEEIWFGERMDDRSTRDSSRKVYRILSSRLKSASSSLPHASVLADIFDRCDTVRDKAQILYLYLIDSDPLVKYTVHEYVRILLEEGKDLDFSDEGLERVLQDFSYADGSGLEYSDSTLYRWKQGFRSVMRDIGCIESERSTDGEPPVVGDVPLLVSSGYSWEEEGDSWAESPVGWQYLFQPQKYWEKLAGRLADFDNWEANEFQGSLRLKPTESTYAWAKE